MGNGTLTVTDGTGGGDYLPGTVVNIAANVAPENQVFEMWTGDTANITSINLPNTTNHHYRGCGSNRSGI